MWLKVLESPRRNSHKNKLQCAPVQGQRSHPRPTGQDTSARSTLRPDASSKLRVWMQRFKIINLRARFQSQNRADRHAHFRGQLKCTLRGIVLRARQGRERKGSSERVQIERRERGTIACVHVRTNRDTCTQVRTHARTETQTLTDTHECIHRSMHARTHV